MFLSVRKLKLNHKGKMNVKKKIKKNDKQTRKKSPPQKKRKHTFFIHYEHISNW